MDIDILKRIKAYEEYKIYDAGYFSILIDDIMVNIFELPINSSYVEKNIDDFEDLLLDVSISRLVNDYYHEICLIKIKEEPVFIFNQYKGGSVFYYTILDHKFLNIINNIMNKFIHISNRISSEVNWIENLVEHNDLELIYEKGENI